MQELRFCPNIRSIYLRKIIIRSVFDHCCPLEIGIAFCKVHFDLYHLCLRTHRLYHSKFSFQLLYQISHYKLIIVSCIMAQFLPVNCVSVIKVQTVRIVSDKSHETSTSRCARISSKFNANNITIQQCTPTSNEISNCSDPILNLFVSSVFAQWAHTFCVRSVFYCHTIPDFEINFKVVRSLTSVNSWEFWNYYHWYAHLWLGLEVGFGKGFWEMMTWELLKSYWAKLSSLITFLWPFPLDISCVVMKVRLHLIHKKKES